MSLYHTSNRDRLRTFWPVLLLVVLSFAVYINALWGGFVYDDTDQILKNAWIRDASNIPKLFTTGVWAFSGIKLDNYFRPVMHLVYMADYYLFGLNPWGFHLTNIVLHACVTVMVYLLSMRLLTGAGGYASRMAASASFVSAALFAAHPIHTEAVTWIAGLPEVSFSLFYLASLFMYIRSLEAGGKGHWLSVALFLVSCFCKETALTLPLLIICYDHLYLRRKERPVVYIKRYIPYFLVVCVYMSFRFKALGGFAPNYRYTKLSAYEQVINVLPLFGKYILKVLMPFNLNAFHVLHPIHSLWETRGILSIALAACFCLALAAAAAKDRRALMCLVIFLVPLIPVFYISGLGENTFTERYLYLPSFGFVMMAGMLYVWLMERRAHAAAAVAALGFVLCAYSVGTIKRNIVWENGYNLWTDTVAKSPDASMAHLNLGVVYYSEGRYGDALAQLDTASSLKPSNPAIPNNIGLIYFKRGRVDKAIYEFNEALRLDPNRAEPHYNLGRAYYSKGLLDKAIEEYKAAIRIKPYYLEAHNRLGMVYFDKGLPDKAVEEQMAAVRIDPASAKAHYRLGLAYKAEGDLDKAVTEYLAAIRLGPSAEIYNNLGNAYAARGELDSAIAQYRKSLALNPGYGLARHNMELALRLKAAAASGTGDKSPAVLGGGRP